MTRSASRTRGGFHLLEPLIYIMVIATLASAGFVGYQRVVTHHSEQLAIAELFQIAQLGQMQADRDRRPVFDVDDFENDLYTLQTAAGPLVDRTAISLQVSGSGFEVALAAIAPRGECVLALVPRGGKPEFFRDRELSKRDRNCEASAAFGR
jgi:type II secretory pathway pseudopilin PulG